MAESEIRAGFPSQVEGKGDGTLETADQNLIENLDLASGCATVTLGEHPEESSDPVRWLESPIRIALDSHPHRAPQYATPPTSFLAPGKAITDPGFPLRPRYYQPPPIPHSWHDWFVHAVLLRCREMLRMR